MDDSTVAAGWTFLLSDGAGRCSRVHHGFYHSDTRSLDRYELAIGDRPTEPIAALACLRAVDGLGPSVDV